MRFRESLQQKGLTDRDLVKAYDGQLSWLREQLTPDAFNVLFERFYARREQDGFSTLALGLPGIELDFAMAASVYSDTPRLLLRVPQLGAGENRLTLNPLGQHDNVKKLGWGGTPLPDDAVLELPNQEGPQTDVSDRPIVHWSGLRSGEFVIVGHVYNLTEHEVVDAIREAMPDAPQEGDAVLNHYETKGRVKDLVKILEILREMHYSNFYNTNKAYVDGSTPVFTGTEGSGLRKRAKDREVAATMYIPGDTRLGYSPQEQITGGGYAAKIISRDKDGKGKELPIRPLSNAFASQNYFYNLPTGAAPQAISVVPTKGQMLFVSSHPARLQEGPIETFLEKVGSINTAYRNGQPIPSM